MYLIEILKEHYPEQVSPSDIAGDLKAIKMYKEKTKTSFYYILDEDKLLVFSDDKSTIYYKNSDHYKKFVSIFREIKLNELGV